MKNSYEIVLLSNLLKKSRVKTHNDFVKALNFIYERLNNITPDSPDSQFNNQINFIKKFLPKTFLIKLLYRLRYDAMIGIHRNEEGDKVYGMISFQKHPSKLKIGMFDIYIKPERRDKALVNHFQKLSHLVYQLTKEFEEAGYIYIQCGLNKTTRKLLKLYKRMCRRNSWDSVIDIQNCRIYLN